MLDLSILVNSRFSFYHLVLNLDGFVKSQNWEGKVKSSICKARKTLGVRRTYKVSRNDEGEAQRRRWTFCEAINLECPLNSFER
jgi:hypothetical protein